MENILMSDILAGESDILLELLITLWLNGETVQ